jgi:hypothetical protein
MFVTEDEQTDVQNKDLGKEPLNWQESMYKPFHSHKNRDI